MTTRPPLITLLTDFGTRDAFVGTVKGVILGLCPGARLVDLTHEIAPGDVRAGGFALWSAASFFPPGTVHLAVVDPGVGGLRRAIVLRGAGAWFVGPDNGLLWPAAAREGEPSAWEIGRAVWTGAVSATFHGRDLFAPAAARLASGEAPESFCSPVPEVARLDWPLPQWEGSTVRGEVLYVDRFGNAITNLSPVDLGSPLEGEVLFEVAGRQIRGPSSHYGATAAGELVIVPGSAGFYEVAVNRGDAAAALGLQVGSAVSAHLALPARPGRG